MSTTEIIELIAFQLKKLKAIDLGYPIGENQIQIAEQSKSLSERLLERKGGEWLVNLYSECDGISLPDIHNGYFVHRLSRLLSPTATVPHTLLLDREIDILTFGSTGGGDLFAVGCDSGEVYLLSPGAVEQGRYDGNRTSVKQIATSVDGFLERLLSDITAFVDNDRLHDYLSPYSHDSG